MCVCVCVCARAGECVWQVAGWQLVCAALALMSDQRPCASDKQAHTATRTHTATHTHTHLQARQVGLTLAKRMMPPAAVEGVATVMLRVCAPGEGARGGGGGGGGASSGSTHHPRARRLACASGARRLPWCAWAHVAPTSTPFRATTTHGHPNQHTTHTHTHTHTHTKRTHTNRTHTNAQQTHAHTHARAPLSSSARTSLTTGSKMRMSGCARWWSR
jgi:hypothetical protein